MKKKPDWEMTWRQALRYLQSRFDLKHPMARYIGVPTHMVEGWIKDKRPNEAQQRLLIDAAHELGRERSVGLMSVIASIDALRDVEHADDVKQAQAIARKHRTALKRRYWHALQKMQQRDQQQ